MPIPLIYKPIPIGNRFKANIIVTRNVIPKIKSIAATLPIHEAQRHTYLRLSGPRIGPIPNVNARRLTAAIRRFILEPQQNQPLRLPWPSVTLRPSSVLKITPSPTARHPHPDRTTQDHRPEALFSPTAARTSAMKASPSNASPSRRSIARLVFPSRLALNKPEGSNSEAPLANVSFTTPL